MTVEERLRAEIERALQELDELYTACKHNDDMKGAIAARKERSRMLNLNIELLRNEYSAAASAAEHTVNSELTEIRRHLEPLELASPGTPLAELARLAALKMTEK
jgi:hypothetical protein